MFWVSRVFLGFLGVFLGFFWGCVQRGRRAPVKFDMGIPIPLPFSGPGRFEVWGLGSARELIQALQV